MGGATSLRGYSEKSIGPQGLASTRYGPAMLYGSVEARKPYAWKLLGLVVFADAGNRTAAAEQPEVMCPQFGTFLQDQVDLLSLGERLADRNPQSAHFLDRIVV